MRSLFALLACALWPLLLTAAEQRGSVRAADQYLPGAAVTARQGDTRVSTFTDESGRYVLNLGKGEWEIQVEMFGFTPVRAQVFVGDERISPPPREFTLEMPRYGETAANPAPATKAEPKTEARTEARTDTKTEPKAEPKRRAQSPAPPRRPGQRGGAPRQGFQNASVTATAEGQQALAQAADPTAGAMSLDSGEAEEALLVSGSTSGGLAAASDEESRRQRYMSHTHDSGGPPPGMPGDGPGGFGLPPGMGGPGGDLIGLGGLGASAINGGFGDGGPGIGGPGGPGGPGGRGGDRGERGGFSRGSSRGRDSRGGSSRRGPYNGQYSSFGNRRRQPSYTGSAFGFLSNSALNAAPFSLNGQAQPKPSYARATFGVSFGGPLTIPKLVNWQRASFYFTYQGNRSRNPFSEVSSVPTLAERGGDFSQARANAAVAIFDPLNGQPFGGNAVPATRFSSAAAGLLQYFPLPTYTGIVQNYRIVASVPNTSNNIGVRLNAPLSRKDRLTFNVQFQNRDSQTERLFGFRDAGTGTGLSASAGWSHSFAPRFNNSANVSLSRNNNKAAPFFAYQDNVAARLGITGTSQDPINYGPPNLSFTNFGALSDSTASVGRSQTVNLSDGVTYVVKKKHNVSVGFQYRRLQQNSLTYANARGAFSFSGLLTSQLDANGQPVAHTGFDFADFLLGLPQSSSLRFGSDNNYFRSWSTSWHAQDDYRLSRGLSINIGLRYEYFAPYTELFGHLANLDVAPGMNAVSVVTSGHAQAAPYAGALPASLVRGDPNNYSPRLGIAWRPLKKKSMVVRGGYSIFYSGSSYSQIATQMASQPPFATTASLTTSPAFPLTLQNGFPQVPSQTVTNTYAVNPDYKLAYAQTWLLAVQNTLPHGLFLELEYIGTKGTDLSVMEQPNRATPGSPLTAQQRLQISNATGFNYQTIGGNSSFNAGQVRMTRRFSRGMSATALYTFSRAIDDASGYNGTGGAIVQFTDDWHNERGLSSFDQRHRLQTTYMLSSPVGVHGILRNGGWKTTALTGWTLSGSFAASSGTPLTAQVSGNLANTGGIAAFGTGRAQATGLGIHAGDSPYFNLLAFTTPFAGEYGNAGRDTIPGLFNMSLNASLNRSFRLGDDRRRLQLRLSASNALNHVVITNIGTTVNAATYGLASAASATSTVQLMLRVNF